MKLLLIFLCAVFSVSAHAVTLTKAQQKQILQGLSHYCGDAWCAGEYDYKFKAIECSRQGDSCRLSFSLVNRAKKMVFPSSCSYAPVKSLSDLMDRRGPNPGDRLVRGFTRALDECFDKAERRFSRKKTSELKGGGDDGEEIEAI